MTKYGNRKERMPLDLYQTPKSNADAIFDHLGVRSCVHWEPFAGDGNICRSAIERDCSGIAWDIKQYSHPLDRVADFLNVPAAEHPDYDFLISNPPYGPKNKQIVPIVQRILKGRPIHGVVVLLLPAEFDSGKTRQSIFRKEPLFRGKIKLTERVRWFEDLAGMENHAWFVWGPTWYRWRSDRAPILDHLGMAS